MKINRKHIVTVAGLLAAPFFISSCQEQKVVVNREVQSSQDGQMLLGRQSLSQFEKSDYSWYGTELENYSTDKASIAQLKKRGISSYQILVFLGTWCDDSHREFPRLVKILQEAGYPMDKLQIIAVNRKKESPEGEEGPYNIQRVPTIVVKKYGREIGRIVEMPSEGWIERDLLRIIENSKPAGVKGMFDKDKS